ncbi:MAG: NUDIX domain-containing protein [bacterium]
MWRKRRQQEVRILVTTEEGVLLLKRPHPPVWEMPGGEIDPGETPADAAVRETREETGLEVRLTGLLGTFHRSGWLGGCVHLYRATPIGGCLATNADESHRLAYFPAQRSIRLMLPWHRPYWSRALAAATDEVTAQRIATRDVLVMVALSVGYWLGLLRDPVEAGRA